LLNTPVDPTSRRSCPPRGFKSTRKTHSENVLAHDWGCLGDSDGFEVAAGVVMTACPFGWNRRFVMSAWKTLILPLLICGTTAGTVHADAISWPSGLDNWVVYLAAPAGLPGTGPLAYTTSQNPLAQVQATPTTTSATPIQTTSVAPDASSPLAPAQAATNTTSLPSSPPTQDQTTANSASPALSPSVPATAPPVPVPTYTAPASWQSSTPIAPTTPQPSTVQPLSYIQPVSSQPSSVSASTSTPLTVVSNTSQASSHIAATTPSLSVVAPAPIAASAPVQAFINVGNGPYPLAAAITTGGAQPWFNSGQLTSFFGGQPTAQQIQSFDSTVLQRVQQTFSQSGISVSLTENPNVPALHTISLVSNTASSSLPSAIGMTQVGASGFSFIDQIAQSASSLDQLEWIVAHNISHELMLAFGVPENYDTTGNFIDSKMANWAMMVSPGATFSSAAAQAINQALAAQNQPASNSLLGAQELNPAPPPIPEPATLAMWGLAAIAFVVSRRLRARRISFIRTP
jgi:hypothetical protein